jgi:hypothetical protein
VPRGRKEFFLYSHPHTPTGKIVVNADPFLVHGPMKLQDVQPTFLEIFGDGKSMDLRNTN